MNRPIAELSKRVIACAIDIAVPVLVAIVVWSILEVIQNVLQRDVPAALTLLWVALIAVVFVLTLSAMQGAGGSGGMRLVGIRLISAEDLRPIGFLRALVRNLVFFALCAVIIGFFTVLFDRSGGRQGWHDRVVASIVVQRRKRREVMPQLSPSDKRASEWLAAMEEPVMSDNGPITDVPMTRINTYMTTTEPPRRGMVIDSVPGVSESRNRSAQVPQRPTGRLAEEQPSVKAGETVAAPAVLLSEVPEALAPVAEQATESAVDAAHAVAEAPVAEGSTAQPERKESAEPVEAAEVPQPARSEAAAEKAAQSRPVPGPRRAGAMPSRAELAPVVAAHENAPAAAGIPVAPLDEPAPAADSSTRVVAQENVGPRAVATLVWDDGAHHRIYSRTVFGRNPDPADRSQIATIPDDSLSLSKTHFEISRTENDGVEIIDLHSTNGVVVRRAGKARKLSPGQPMELRSGDVLEIGSRRARAEVVS